MEPLNNNDLGDISPDLFRKYLHQVADWIADYREHIAERRVSPQAAPGAILRALPAQPPESGESLDEILRDTYELIIPGILHWGHPQFLAYFGCTTTAPGILGEMIAAALNVNAMTWRTSPAATELETLVLDWLRQWLGLTNEFSGVVYDTASVGIMHALAAAREAAAHSIRELGLTKQQKIFRIYTSDQTHSSVEKAAIALGLGEKNVCRVASDAQFRLDVRELERVMAEDVRNGFQPMAVVATVGTTSTESVDPVPEVAAISRRFNAWLHIDGAYGGGLALLPECEWVTKGWNEADSFIVNPHKMLFVPLDFSVLYVKDISRLRRVFALVPEYLVGDSVGAETNYMDYGIQLGRRFRALKAWMVWRTFGRAGMAARIREHMRLARLFAEWVENDPRFELLAPVVMTAVCFGLRAQPNEKTQQLVEQVNASGRAYLTLTKLRGRSAARLGLGNILTNEGHLRAGWELIREVCEQIEKR